MPLRLQKRFLEIGKGGKGATNSDVLTYYDRDIDSLCSRCNRYHKGRIGDDCVMPPCRFCVFEGHEDSNHHLRNCELKPDDWQLPSTLPNASKRQLAIREKPVSDKRQKMTAQQLVATFSENELSEVCAAINTIQSGSEVSAATSDDGEEEAIQFLTNLKLNRTSLVAKSAGSTSKGGDTTHLVPVTAAGMKATATIGSVTRTPRADQHEILRKIAQAKVNESRGPGYRNGLFSVIVDEAPERPHWFDTNDEWFAKRKV